MTTMKTLMLAGVAAMSFGVGSAMAQTSNDPNALTFTNRDLLGGAPTQTVAPVSGQPQSGSSDIDGTQNPDQRFPAWVGYNQAEGAGPGG